MDELEKVYTIIDKSDWDYGELSEIENVFKVCFDKLQKPDQDKYQRLFQIEQEAFAFNKRPDGGLTYKIAGTKKMEDGTEVPYNWPDIEEWKDEDFDYIQNRYKNCKNIFAKTEYGLILFYSGHIKHNAEIKILLEDLLGLAKSYIQKVLADTPTESNLEIKGKNLLNNFYPIYLRTLLINIFSIANKRKDEPEILPFYNDLILFTAKTHNNWDLTLSSSMRGIIDLTYFAIDYYNDFVKVTKIDDFIQKNWETAEFLSKTNVWGAVYTIDVSIILCRLSKVDVKKWQSFKAKQYELLAKESITSSQNLAAISFIEKALRLYREIKDSVNIARLEKWYSEIRGTGNLSRTEAKLSNEESKEITDGIKKEIENNNIDGIFDIFIMCPMFSSLKIIHDEAERFKKQNVLMYTMGGSFLDKFGNTIAKYEGSNDEWAFIQIYSIHFQLGVQKLIYFFIESFKAGKLNYEFIISRLEKSWLNEPIPRNYNRFEMVVKPIDILKPSLNEFMSELELWKSQPDYTLKLVTKIDSMVLKIEALLRYFCDRLGIATFKPKQNDVVMEKTLDEILADLAHQPPERPNQITNFDEDDRRFIKFVMTDKAGHNLRNKVAHGLMDINEYTIEKIILAFTVIMRLSKYKFVENKPHEHTSS